MMTYIVDVVLLVALALTSLRVTVMHRELRRLRSYQTQYVQVFGETSRAADNIGAAVREIGGEGRTVLARLEAAIERAGAVSKRLEAMARAAEPRPSHASDDIGTYSRKPTVARGSGEPVSEASRNEILKFAGDSPRPRERRVDAAFEKELTLPRPGREVRFAPSVKTVRAVGGGS